MVEVQSRHWRLGSDMSVRRTFALAAALVTLVVLPLRGQGPVTDRTDPSVLQRIEQEAQRSGLMDTVSYLTDVYGPRLTGSPNIREAAEWTQKTMTAWGISNVHLETWPLGRGWQNERFFAMAIAPRTFPLIGYPKAWTPGTRGPVTGEAIMAVIESDKDFAIYRGNLRGKFVLSLTMRDVPAHFEAPGHRFTDAELLELAKKLPNPRRPGARGDADPTFRRRRTQFWIDEGVAAVLDFGRGDGGTVFVQSGGSRDPKDPPVPPQVTLTVEHYGRIARMLARQVPVTLQMDVANRFDDADLTAFNIIGEIPGTDKADEVVMLGAHFDSWHAGTGATDNAAGSAVMLETMRILKATELTLRRTVRLGLWTGEEQGLMGSREYVKAHFGDPMTMVLKPDHAKLAAYFNLDNGTEKIRGVYLQGNEAVGPIFSAWMDPFRTGGMTTLAPRRTGGTDHLSFEAIGLPGFQFIQDAIEYNTRTHHSNMDVYERLQVDDLLRNAVIIASFAYNAANREEKLPRKPLPKPSATTAGARP